MEPWVRGRPVDLETRCVHWSSPLDVVAFRFPCCEGWWPCHLCHEEEADHAATPWPRARQEDTVLCGRCQVTMTPDRYMASGSTCPHCGAGFNPACRAHWPRYFES
ncbi:MAG: CHY zinc finger protein [Thermoplasmatota archaeon]